jgi:hypothetical protein
MPPFDWILREPLKAHPTVYELADFLRRCGLSEHAEWERAAEKWGWQQKPPIKFSLMGDSSIPGVGVRRDAVE